MTLTCPHCQKPADIPDVVFVNADRYANSPVSKTGCCGRAVKVHRRVTYSLSASNRSEDDWGEPCKAPLPVPIPDPDPQTGWLPAHKLPDNAPPVDIWVLDPASLVEYRLQNCFYDPIHGWFEGEKPVTQIVLYYRPLPDSPGNLTIVQKKALVAR